MVKILIPTLWSGFTYVSLRILGQEEPCLGEGEEAFEQLTLAVETTVVSTTYPNVIKHDRRQGL